MVGTFTYCLLVLRVVHGATAAGGQAFVPRVSVDVATVLGIGAILAILGFISHAARSMQVGEIIRRITDGPLGLGGLGAADRRPGPAEPSPGGRDRSR